MKARLRNCGWMGGLCGLWLGLAQAAEEQDLMQVLSSTASIPAKAAACQQLRVMGTAKSVPAMAALLEDARTSQFARQALEGMPWVEAGAALREALGKTSGAVQAGVVHSLGWRREVESVQPLTALLGAADSQVASASAVALGRIGGAEATAALRAARGRAAAAVLPSVGEGLLGCAEGWVARGDRAEAATLYRELWEDPPSPGVRVAAWRGLATVMVDAGRRAEFVRQALIGTDEGLRAAACRVLREAGDGALVAACLQDWAALSAEGQLAVLDAQLQVGGEKAAAMRRAAESAHASVRLAGLSAMGDASDPAVVGGLVKAAAAGEAAEREAAREALSRLRGAGVREALLRVVAEGEAAQRAEVLRALGERGDREAAGLLVEQAAAGAGSARRAALESLGKLALPETLGPLLALALRTQDGGDLDAVIQPLYAVVQASPDREAAEGQVVEAIRKAAPAERRLLLPLLAELGSSRARSVLEEAAKDGDSELAREAVRVLGQWPDASPVGFLLELARSSADLTLHTLAFRGGVEVASHEADAGRRLGSFAEWMRAARRADERKLVLAQMGQMEVPAALEVVLKHLEDAELVNEAGLAAIGIAEKVAPKDPALADAAAVQVLAKCKGEDTVRRAWALRRVSAVAGSFIREWLVCGPYRQAGVDGAEALFHHGFGPEKPGENVEWRAVPSGDHANLAALYPDQVSCVAYLRARIVAPAAGEALLLMGSDDGLKAWWNGEVVHSNNVDRGMVVDQDRAPVKLKAGANELLLKVTQGGGGWAACARIVGVDGKPLEGLRVERLTAAAASPLTVAPPPPPPTPKAAALPPRGPIAYEKLRLSDQFYAEGAYHGDFNRDGRRDIVAGPFWFEGPDFAKRHAYRAEKVFDPKEYSDNFLTFAGDFNGDGWDDILCVPFPGIEGYWYANPAGTGEAWKRYLAYDKVGNESPVWGDVTGDGRPELVFCNEGFLGYAGPDLTRPGEPWKFQAVSTRHERYQRFTHGVGIGDLNGDRRVDVLEAVGWWEQPAELKADEPWTFHPFHFADAAAQMLVQDVNGDGLADVITAWHCHLYGLVWWQQLRKSEGGVDWKKHVILSPSPDITTTEFRVSQLHAFDLVDMNRDGLMDVLTGKRFWAHGPTGDKEPEAPAVVFWLELRRDGQGGVSFIPHLIDDDSGVGTQVAAVELNGDGVPDVVVGNKKGIFVHRSRAGTK